LKKMMIAILFILLLFAGFIGVRFGSALTQEGNPALYLVSAAKLELAGNGYEKIYEAENENQIFICT
jgi:hypothetical protein